MINVVCPNLHYTQKKSSDSWRSVRACHVCGEATVIDYRGNCSHHGWRYPNEVPLDGDACSDCGQSHVEPMRGMTEDELERARGIGEIASVVLEENDGYYTKKEATEALRAIFAAHGFHWPKKGEGNV